MDLDINAISDFLSSALSHQVTQFTIAFTIAAWIHSGRVRKEIASQMSRATDAINNLSTALRSDLNNHAQRISAVEGTQNLLTNRVDALEKRKK